MKVFRFLSPVVALVACAVSPALCLAASTTIDFDGLTPGVQPVGTTFSEDGFDVEVLSADALASDIGGGDVVIGADNNATTALIQISRAATFSLAEFMGRDLSGGTQAISVTGFLGAVTVGAETFFQGPSFFANSPSSSLVGAQLDRVVFSLPAAGFSFTEINDVVLDDFGGPTPIPEPSSIALLSLAGVGCFWRARRRKNQTA